MSCKGTQTTPFLNWKREKNESTVQIRIAKMKEIIQRYMHSHSRLMRLMQTVRAMSAQKLTASVRGLAPITTIMAGILHITFSLFIDGNNNKTNQ